VRLELLVARELDWVGVLGVEGGGFTFGG
jgi:hypothetical protein